MFSSIQSDDNYWAVSQERGQAFDNRVVKLLDFGDHVSIRVVLYCPMKEDVLWIPGRCRQHRVVGRRPDDVDMMWPVVRRT